MMKLLQNDADGADGDGVDGEDRRNERREGDQDADSRGRIVSILQNVLQNPHKTTQSHAFSCIDVHRSFSYHDLKKTA
jgi:hypothetical protein